MDAKKEKEEIIELTEVIEEGPAFALVKERPERLPASSEKQPPPILLKPADDPVSGLPDSTGRMEKEPLTREPENRAAQEENQLGERPAMDLIPRMVAERITREIAKLKAETEALQARGEAFSRKLEEWFSTEGLKLLEGKAGDAVPRIVAKTLSPEIETLQKEMEKYRAGVEDLNRQAQTWFTNEGKQVLEKVAREVFPQMAEKILRQEIEKLKEENPASDNE